MSPSALAMNPASPLASSMQASRFLIAHKAQVGANVFLGSRASSPRGSWCAFGPSRAGSPRSQEVVLSRTLILT